MPSKSFKTNNVFLASLKEKEEAKKEGKLLEVEVTTVPQKTRRVKLVSADPDPTEERASAPSIPEGFKLVSTETKSKRLQLLITPSLHTKLQNLAKAENTSVNEVANRAFDYYIENYLNGGF